MWKYKRGEMLNPVEEIRKLLSVIPLLPVYCVVFLLCFFSYYYDFFSFSYRMYMMPMTLFVSIVYVGWGVEVYDVGDAGQDMSLA
jgi:hypothetical protein